MYQVISKLSVLLLLATAAACVEPLPSPPTLVVTSPERSTVQSGAGQIQVAGNALPGLDGDPVATVTVNGVAATLDGNGSFTAMVDVPAGVTLLETVAIGQSGGKATDARAVEAGALQPVGSNISHAVTATLSTDTFVKLSAAAGPFIATLDLPSLLAGHQPMVSLGDDLANLKLSITKMAFGEVKISLTPTDAGLMFSAEIDALEVGAKADYAGSLVPDGSTTIKVTAAQLTVAGTLVVTPSGTTGFVTTIASPVVTTNGLNLEASGLAGQILSLLNNNLASTVQSVAATSLETAMNPLVNDALGALAGPQQITVLGHTIDLEATPSAVTFTAAGALVTIDLQMKIAGSEMSPGFVSTTDGMPSLTAGSGVQLAVADDLLNEMLAEVHALGLLDIHLQGNYDLFDAADFKLTLPPMIDAHSADGSMKLVIGDMIANLSSNGTTLASAALNAQVDLTIVPGTTGHQISLELGKANVIVNFLSDPTDGLGGPGVSAAVDAGLAVQLDSLTQFLVTVPVPSIAGLTLDNLSLHADNGYVVVGGTVAQ